MSCDDVTAAIVDEGLPRPPGFQAHLEQCPQCRELARLQAAASTLKLPVPPPLAPVPPQSILGEVRRRQHRRRAAAGAAVLGAVATLLFFVVPRQAPPTVPVAEVPLKRVVSETVEPEPTAPEPVDIMPSLALLVDEVESYTQRDLTFDDETYAPFGALALWVRPPEPIALNDRPFRTALAPLHPSPIQELAR